MRVPTWRDGCVQRVRQGNSESQGDGDMRRHLLIAAIFLLAGAVVNVAVAWGTARWGWGPEISYARLAALPPGSEWPRLAPAHWPSPNQATTDRTWAAQRQVVIHAPNWPTEEITYEGGWGMIPHNRERKKKAIASVANVSRAYHRPRYRCTGTDRGTDKDRGIRSLPQ